MTKVLFKISVLGIAAITFFSCEKDKTSTGWEFAPNMYRSLPLDPMSQTVEQEYKYNPYNMTMREPVPGTVSRGYMPYTIPADSFDLAAKVENPIPLTDEVMAEGEELYGRFCLHCHGVEGDGQGLVGIKYVGVPKYNSRAIKDKPMGHVFHVITHGKSRMKSHASQLNQEERWKIAHFVQTLQKKGAE